jgi:hypothetical protein
LVDDRRWDAFNRKRDAVAREAERLKSTWVNPRQSAGSRCPARARPADGARVSAVRPAAPAAGQLRQPADLPGAGEAVARPEVVEQVEIQAKYQGYIERQQDEIDKGLAHESLPLPADLDYGEVRGPVLRGSAKAEPGSAADSWPGVAGAGRHAGGNLAAAGFPEAAQGSMTQAAELRDALAVMGWICRITGNPGYWRLSPCCENGTAPTT